MTTDQYQAALAAAVREYEALGEQRREIDTRLAQLAQTIGTLNRLCGFTPTVYWGLTDACRLVLKGAGHPMTPTGSCESSLEPDLLSSRMRSTMRRNTSRGGLP